MATEANADDVSVERTVLCLAGETAKLNEAAILELLATKYGLAAKQRTERLLETCDAMELAEELFDAVMLEKEQAAADEAERARAESKLNEGAVKPSARSETGASARGTARSNNNTDSARSTESKRAEAEEQAAAARAAEAERERREQRALVREERRRARRRARTCAQMAAALACKHNRDDVVVVSLLGTNAVQALSGAIAADAELCELGGIVAEDLVDDTEIDNQAASQGEHDKSPRSQATPPSARSGAGSDRGEVEEKEDPQSEDEVVEPPATTRFNLVVPSGLAALYVLQQAFLKPPPLGEVSFAISDEEGAGRAGRRRRRARREAVTKSELVDLDEMFKFMFPASEQHPHSTGRMLVFGEYGPLDQQRRLRAGLFGEHSVNRHEIETIVKQIDVADLLYIYVGDDVLTIDEQVEVIKQADPRLRNDKQLTREQAVALFEDLDRTEDGRLVFHDVQATIFKFREDRIQRWKQIATNSVRNKAKPSKLERARRARHERAIRIANREALKPPAKVDDNDIFLLTSKLLNAHSFKICLMEDQHDPALVQNVRILRNETSAARRHGAIPWKK